MNRNFYFDDLSRRGKPPIGEAAIGSAIWSDRNLNVERYRDGTPIPQVQDGTAWASLTTGAWCYYNNDPSLGSIYGKLYNWYAVAGIWDAASASDPSLRKILAPTGWHIPTQSEWVNLSTAVSGDGGSLKSTLYWTSPNTGATNSSGFSALPSGARSYVSPSATPFGLGTAARIWTSTETSASIARVYGLSNASTTISSLTGLKNYGYSVRLVKD